MKRASRWALLLALLGACRAHVPTTPLWEGRMDGARIEGREVRVIAPMDWDGAEPLPVVVLLGGYSWRSWELERWMELGAQVEARRFLLVMPEASLDREGNPFWAATDTCCDWYGAGVDDAGWLEAVFAHLEATYPLDPERFAVVGHSNGAFMGFAMACRPDSPVTHLVSLGGSSYLDPGLCDHREAAVLQVHGDEDAVMPFEGDETAPGAEALLARWGCAELEEVERRSLIGETSIRRDAACPSELWVLEGSDHYPDFNADFNAAMLDWLGIGEGPDRE